MMTGEREIALTFPKCPAGIGNQLAIELQELLTDIAAARGLSGSIQVTVSKEDDTRQDFGATLAIIFATPAAIAIAKGVHDFIAAKGHAVAIQHKNGSVIATGHAAKNIDIAETVHRLNLVR